MLIYYHSRVTLVGLEVFQVLNNVGLCGSVASSNAFIRVSQTPIQVS